MKWHSIIPSALAAAAALAACADGKFTINGTLSDAGTQYLQAAYLSGDSIIEVPVSSVGGKFQIEGSCEDLTVVYIYSAQGRLITHAAAQNGDEITIDGSIADNYAISVGGTSENAEWSGFLKSHAADFKALRFEKTDSAIAAYVRKNPDNVVSTLLLTCDYSNLASPEGRKLMDAIEKRAKPEQLVSLYAATVGDSAAMRPRKLPLLSLRNDGDSLETVKTQGHALTLVYLWNAANADRRATAAALKKLAGDKRLQVVDVCIDSDTIGWRSAFRSDSTEWPHFFAIGGPVDKTIEKLNVRSSPFFIVADSTGTRLYSGPSVDAAASLIEKKLK